jgi:hypothetical protein
MTPEQEKMVADLREDSTAKVEQTVWSDEVVKNCHMIAHLTTGEYADPDDAESWSDRYSTAFYLEQDSAAGRWLYHEAQPQKVLESLVYAADPKDEERTKLLEESAESLTTAINNPFTFSHYLEESTHSNWEGYSNIELQAIMNMLTDFAAAIKDGRI